MRTTLFIATNDDPAAGAPLSNTTLRSLAIGLCALVLGGCGESAPSQPASQSDGAATSTSQAQSLEAALPNSDLSADDAFGRTPPTELQPGPCPFLSDETAIATARTSAARPLVRKQASNDECRWSYNAGFSVRAKIEPLDEATPVEKRRYNIGSDPQLDRQNGPGANAMVLSDTTWGEPRPYAFGFEQDGKSISITVTGLSTSNGQLLAAANEIAGKLPSAPSVEPSRFERVPAMDTCSVWNEDGLLSLFGYSRDDTISISGTGPICRFEFYRLQPSEIGPKISLHFMSHDKATLEMLTGRGAELVSSDGIPILKESMSDQFGTTTRVHAAMGNDEIMLAILDTRGGDREVEALELINNLVARMK